MKRKTLDLAFIVLISIGFQILMLEIWEGFLGKDKPNVSESANGEHFDPSLSRLKTVRGFTKYCDSIYGHSQIASADSEKYAIVVSRVLRDRFYHTFSYYRLGQNSLAYFFAPFIDWRLNAIVIPDDILKHPNAACSQQSIVGMEVFRCKGFNVRKVTFLADGYGGHFCFEAHYDGKWHFFDPDMEPKLSIMIAAHFPPASNLVRNDSLLRNLYFRRDGEYIEKLFASYSYGPVNKFPASKAKLFQYITKYLSYTMWLWLSLLYFFVSKKLRFTNKNQQCAELQGSLVPEIGA